MFRKYNLIDQMMLVNSDRESIPFQIREVNMGIDSYPEIRGIILPEPPQVFSFRAKDPIRRVIFHDPATIVFWKDGSKTVVKCGPHEEFDAEKGLAMAIVKKSLGNKGNYNNVLKKYLPKEDE